MGFPAMLVPILASKVNSDNQNHCFFYDGSLALKPLFLSFLCPGRGGGFRTPFSPLLTGSLDKLGHWTNQVIGTPRNPEKGHLPPEIWSVGAEGKTHGVSSHAGPFPGAKNQF